MKIHDFTMEEAGAFIQEITGQNVLFWMTQLMVTGEHQVQICDYRSMSAYTHAFQCSIHNKDGDMLHRFNVKR